MDVACATCHHPDFAYADGRELSLGPGSVGLGPARRDVSGGRIPVVRRNSPTILNTVFNGRDRRRRGRRSDGERSTVPNQERAPMFWDSRTRSLEAQALEPRLSRSFRRVDDMSDREMDDIVAFLRALTDEDFDRTVPDRVPSGLPPGGRIGGR